MQKPTCHRCRDSVDSRFSFSCFLVALGPVFMTFVTLDSGLKIYDFQCDSGVIPDPESELVEGKLLIPGP